MANVPPTAGTCYGGYARLTTVRRSQTAAKGVLPAHGRPGHTILGLHGDLDVASAPALREHLLATLHHSARQLTLDLGEVSFCNAAGLAVLLGIQRRATGLGITLRLANPRPQVTELLRITGLDRSLSVHTTMHGALIPSPGPSRDGTGPAPRTSRRGSYQ